MPNPVIRFDIVSTDPAATRAFFGEVFGWKSEVIPESGYTLLDTRSEGVGINGGIGPAGEEYGGFITFYIAVDDIQAYLDKAVAAGGKVIMPVAEIPNNAAIQADIDRAVGKSATPAAEIPDAIAFALFSDPAGAVVGLYQRE